MAGQQAVIEHLSGAFLLVVLHIGQLNQGMLAEDLLAA